MKRAYFVCNKYEETIGVVYIAHNYKEAKKMASQSCDIEFDEYIDIRVRWIKDADINDLDFGLVDSILGLKRDLYSWIDGKCEICFQQRQLYHEFDKALCSDCMDELSKKNNN